MKTIITIPVKLEIEYHGDECYDVNLIYHGEDEDIKEILDNAHESFTHDCSVSLENILNKYRNYTLENSHCFSRFAAKLKKYLGKK